MAATKAAEQIVRTMGLRQTNDDTVRRGKQNGVSKVVSTGYPQRLRKAFADPKQLVEAFSIGYLTERRRQMGLRTLRDCVAAPYPTLKDLELTYNDAECPQLVLEAYVTNLNDACNANRMNESQIREAGEILLQEAPYLKLTEVHEFFRRVKAAYYGEYFGSLDVMKIMADFRLFLADRLEALNRVRAAVARRKRETAWRTEGAPMPESLRNLANYSTTK